MSKIHASNFLDNLNIIWTIASKDIVDALKNRTVVTMIIMLSVILLMPKMLPLIFEQPQLVLPVYDTGSASLVVDLQNVTGISVRACGQSRNWQPSCATGCIRRLGCVFLRILMRC